MEIRAAQESELEQVVELNCIAFNPGQHERYWQYVRGDSSYRLSQTRVVVVNDRVVSTLRVWERRIRIGVSLVTMGGIGGVCTDPKYRGVGYASALMQDTIGYLHEVGCDIGVLFTIIPEKFYHRLEWTSFPLRGFKVKFNSAIANEKPSDWQIRDFNLETDLDAVASIYDTANAQQSGAISRTRAYWDMKPSRIRGILPTVVAQQNGNIGGYLNYEIDDGCATVHEIGCLPDNPDILDALLFHLLQACAADKVEEIEGIFSPQHPFVERLKTVCNSDLNPITDTTMMLYAVSLPVLLRRLVVEWEAQIAASEESFPSLAVKFPTVNDQQTVLRYDGNNTIQIADDASDAVNLEISEADFWQMLFGEIRWEQVESDVSVSSEVSAFLGTLFPKRDVIFWYPDRY
ncbi:MAG: GNAT family N-acetyltransferase [Candidatus Poribacteria bacterium]|nr:GNAT family N-acetyltransferase [Candidatus Poribacteria bacterium]